METMDMDAAQKGIVTRITVALAALLAALCICGCSLMTPTRAEVEQRPQTPLVDASALIQEGTLTVALDTTGDAPQGMVDQDGRTTGYYADVARALADNLGLHIAFVDAPSASSSVGEGVADIFIGASGSEATDEISVFGSCLENAPALFAVEGSMPTPALTALAGKTVAVQDGSAAQDALNKAGSSAEQVVCRDVNECFETLAAGRADCVACDATAGAYLARTYDNIAFAGTLDATTVTGVATLSSNSELAQQVGAAFDSISADGTLAAVHASWYGSLPLSLSDTLLSGVTIKSNEQEDIARTPDADDELDLSDINEFDG